MAKPLWSLAGEGNAAARMLNARERAISPTGPGRGSDRHWHGWAVGRTAAALAAPPRTWEDSPMTGGQGTGSRSNGVGLDLSAAPQPDCIVMRQCRCRWVSHAKPWYGRMGSRPSPRGHGAMPARGLELRAPAHRRGHVARLGYTAPRSQTLFVNSDSVTFWGVPSRDAQVALRLSAYRSARLPQSKIYRVLVVACFMGDLMACILRGDLKMHRFFPATAKSSNPPHGRRPSPSTGLPADEYRRSVSDGGSRVLEQLQALRKALGEARTSIADAGS